MNKTLIMTMVGLALWLAPALQAQIPRYVDDARPDDSGDGLDWTTAKKTIAAAVADAAAGDTVWVTNGTYNVTAEILIDKGISVRSMSGAATTTVQRTGTGEIRIFNINHADARLEGFTIRNGYGQHGSGVYLVAGTVADCIIRDNPVKSWGGHNGMGVWMSGGTVTNCVIRNNGSPGNTFFSGNGGGVYMTGGLLTHSTVVSNLFFTNQKGMGIWASGANTTISHCIIKDNKETRDGSAGGVYLQSSARLRNSLVRGNSVTSATLAHGGGIYMTGAGTVVESCTVVENSAGASGGGIYMAGGAVTNCIVYFNTASTGANYVPAGSGLAYSCATPLPAGTDNTADDPQFVDRPNGDFHVGAGPARSTGFVLPWMNTSTDLAGGPRLDLDSSVDRGAYQTQGGALECSLSVVQPSYGIAPLTVAFTSQVLGLNQSGLYYLWDFDDNGTPDAEGFGKSAATNDYESTGAFTVRLTVTNSAGEIADFVLPRAVTATLEDIFVSNSGTGQSPYTNLATAATNVLDAVRIAGAGTTVRVAGGTYDITETIEMARGIRMIGLDGAEHVTIQRTGASGFRVVNVTHNDVVIEGLTIRNGRTDGAGIRMTGGTVRDCIIRDNRAETWAQSGGGIYMTGGSVSNCVIQSNYAAGGAGAGVYLSGGELRSSSVVSNTLFSNSFGAGIYASGSGVLVSECTIAFNAGSRDESAGGAYVGGGAKLRNVLVRGNRLFDVTTAGKYGGGVYVAGAGSLVENCTVVSNTVPHPTGFGGGIYRTGGDIRNSIVVFNTAASDRNYSGASANLTYSCTEPPLVGTYETQKNLAVDPLSLDPPVGDFRLHKTSPAIDAGLDDLTWMPFATDLAGAPRLLNKAVDMGAYETLVPPSGTVLLMR